jgi:DNA-binding MarR family transcriptional regulator
MAVDTPLRADDCNCLAVRQAARHVTQFYDHYLAPAGLRTTQFSILVTLTRRGPLTINALAAAMVMDRTTLGRNILPLERDGLVTIASGKTDRRSKEVRLTERGAERLQTAIVGWTEAQAQFDTVFGRERAAGLRTLLRHVSATDFGGVPAGVPIDAIAAASANDRPQP